MIIQKVQPLEDPDQYLVAVDPPAKSESFFGGIVENTFLSTKKLKSKDPTQ